MASLEGTGDRPGWHHSGDHDTLMKVKNFWRPHFTKGTGETITWKAEKVGVVTMTMTQDHCSKFCVPWMTKLRS